MLAQSTVGNFSLKIDFQSCWLPSFYFYFNDIKAEYFFEAVSQQDQMPIKCGS